MSKKPFWCRLGFHAIRITVECIVTDPPAGEYDPRSAEQRTYRSSFCICPKCGHKEYGSGGCDL